MRVTRTLAAALGMALIAALPAGAAAVSVAELDADPIRYDGQIITITGEAIGDYGRTRTHVWIQLNDDPYATNPLTESGNLAGTNVGIGVRLPTDLFSSLWGDPGRSGTRGPLLVVTGRFHHNSDADQGETFVAAESVSLVEPSRPIPPTVHRRAWPSVMGTALLALGIALFVVGRVKRFRH